jgi:hypothetical protein
MGAWGLLFMGATLQLRFGQRINHFRNHYEVRPFLIKLMCCSLQWQPLGTGLETLVMPHKKNK